MNETTRGEIEVNLRDVFSVILKRWWIILLATILCGALFFGYAYATHTPMFKSTAKMYVNNDASEISGNKVSISSSDIYAAQALVNTYCEIIKSRSTMKAVIEKAELQCSEESLLGMVSCGSVNGTEVFYISVVSDSRVEAKRIANAIVEVLPDQIASVIEGSSVRTVDTASIGKELAPGYSTKMAIGAFIGFVLSLGFFFVYDVLINDTLQTEDWVAQYFKEEIPLLAVIPDVNYSGGKRYGRYKYYRHSYYTSKTEDSNDGENGKNTDSAE